MQANIMLAGAEQELSQTGKEHRLKEVVAQVAGDYDFIVIDTTPSLGVLTVNAFTCATDVLIPTTAGIFATAEISQLNETVTSVQMYPYNQKCLKELKYALTRQIWNRYTSTIKEPQMQGILQGFRVVGSGSKLDREYPVTAYRFGGEVTLEELLEFIPDSNGEQQYLVGLMRKGRLSLAEAKEKCPDWYERRIVKKERRDRWVVKRDLYDWWLHRIEDEIRVGHRFYGIMTLAIYAKKYDIDEDELRQDAFSLLKPYDDMSIEDINRFTKDDVVCALEMFNEDYVTFPRDDIARLSGLSMPVNKRNWRKRREHLQVMNTMKALKKQLGEPVKEGRPAGSGTAQDRVQGWHQQHPEGRKADCHRDTGLDPKTIRKWWDCSV